MPFILPIFRLGSALQLESEPEVKQIGEAPEDVPFAIPEKWKWLPLNKFSEKRRTVSPNTITGEVELWSIPAYDAGSPEKVNSKHIGSSKKEVVNGDVLLSKIVPNIKRAWIVKSDWNWDVGAEFRISIKKPELRGLRP